MIAQITHEKISATLLDINYSIHDLRPGISH
jgi:hypothetical protein